MNRFFQIGNTTIDWDPHWAGLLAKDTVLWEERIRKASEKGKRVLIANSLPCFPISTMMESMLSIALTLRGAEVHFLICDGVLSACMNLKITGVQDPAAIVDGTWKDHKSTCQRCETNRSVFEGIGLPIHTYSDYLTQQDREKISSFARSITAEEIPSYQYDGLAIGEHSYAGCLRYFSRGDLENVPRGEEVLQKYFAAALETRLVTERLLKEIAFDVVCFHHGIYIPQGVIGEVCRRDSVRVVNWNPAYRRGCFVFSHNDTYHHTLLDEPVSEWKAMRYSATQESEILSYLKSRWSGAEDWIWFHDAPNYTDRALVMETGIDLSKPIIGLLTNVVWDAQLHYRANAFPGMLAWLEKTIRYFAGRTDLQLLIRVHPAEIRGTQPSRQLVVDEIKMWFPTLPKNVFVIPPESNVGTYSAMQKCNSVIIYGTKTGVELASMGIPVIVAGEAWIRNKGLTIDISSETEYFDLLDRLPLPAGSISPERVNDARKYAYHFFLRRMIPVKSVKPVDDKVPFRTNVLSLKALLPHEDPGLDVICDGILEGTPFVFKNEEL